MIPIPVFYSFNSISSLLIRDTSVFPNFFSLSLFPLIGKEGGLGVSFWGDDEPVSVLIAFTGITHLTSLNSVCL